MGSSRWRKRAGLAALGLAVVAGGIWGVRAYLYGRAHATTDDATLQGHISPVLSRVEGYVAQVLVDDNQHVAQGQLLAVIDPAQLRLAVQQAEAALHNAQAMLATARAQEQNAKAQRRAAAAQVRAGEARAREALREARRQDQLLQAHATPSRAAEQARTASAEASAKVEALRQEESVADAAVQQAQAGVPRAQAGVAQAQAALGTARLKLGYTELRAPIAGRVSKKSVEPGQYVREGAPLMAIAQERGTWVVANFKEGDIADIRPGQPVTIDVDAYPSHTFHGRVDSVAAATGSEFALLPSDDANANFVKVEKRVPVKIVFTDPGESSEPLRPGLNVEVAISTAASDDGRAER